MNYWGDLKSIQSAGIDYYRAIAEHLETMGVDEVARELGITKKSCKRALWVWRHFRKKRHQKLVEAAQLSVQTLEVIASRMYALGKKHPRWDDVLADLINASNGLSPDEAHDACDAIIQGILNDEGRGTRKAALGIQREADAFGQRRAMLRLDDAEMGDVEHILTPVAKQLRKENPELAHCEAQAKALVRVVKGSQEAMEAPVAPTVLIALDDPYMHKDGLVTGRGTVIPWERAVDIKLAEIGYALIIAKDEKGVPQAVREPIRRFANDDERAIAALETLRCVWPGCNRVAADCQTHHIRAHYQGGPTSTPNLCSLCKEHNGQNDDDPHRPKNGRIKRHQATGELGRIAPPEDQDMVFNSNPIIKFGWRAYALRRLRIPSARP